MSPLFTQNALNPKVAISLASGATYYIYKKYEPNSVLSAIFLLGVVPGVLAGALRESFSSALAASLTVFSSYWFLIIAFTVAYRLSPFHPLARYPGPLLAKVSKGYLVWRTLKDYKTHLWIKRLHEQYGDVVRIGPNEVTITNKEFTTAILGPKGLPRGPYYDTRRHTAGYSLDGIRDLTEHPHRRRLWARGMSSAAMKYYEALVQGCIEDIVNGFKARADEVVDISAWMNFFGFDFMGHMAFTHDYGLLKNGTDTHNLAAMVEKSMFDVVWLSQIPWFIPFSKWIPGATANWNAMTVVGERAAEYRYQKGSTQRDLFSYLMDEDGIETIRPGKEIVKVDGQVAIGAGGDTAATTLSHLWYFLLRNPKAMDRLRKEVDEAFPPGEESSTDATKQSLMPYLNACIQETLRLYPPVLAGLQRRVEKGSGGRMVGNYFLPEETQVSMWAYAIHRDPKYFYPLPDTFWPDRWLNQNEYVAPTGEIVPADQVITTKEVWMPFSLGPMVCIGKNVALLEIRAVLCALVQQFDMKPVDQTAFDTWEDNLGEVFTTARGKLPVRVSPRHNS